MIVITTILGIMVVILGYTTFNLLRKNEKQEDILTGYMTYLNKISQTIETADKKMQEVDAKGSFKSDDEVGFFFNSLKQMSETLNVYKIRK